MANPLLAAAHVANEAPQPLIQPPLILKYTKQPPETPFFSVGDQHVHVHLEPYNEGAYFILGDGIIPMKPPLLMVKFSPTYINI